MYIYLWKEDIEDGESVMTAEYRPVEYGKDYDVVNNPDKVHKVSAIHSHKFISLLESYIFQYKKFTIQILIQ